MMKADGALCLGTGMHTVICEFDHVGRLVIMPDGADLETYIEKEDLPELIAYLRAAAEKTDRPKISEQRSDG